MPENPASYRVVRTKSYLFNKAAFAIKRRCKNIIIYQSITIISSAGILSSDHKMVFCTKI
ncbi:hypothetical protein FXN98_26515 [Klebsiella pneumoniae]|nr:hypothetical protein FXN98_26515 [Klebsiella pneumoniae]